MKQLNSISRQALEPPIKGKRGSARWAAALLLLPPPLQEFIRVGYYVNTDYADEALREDPPDTLEVDK